MVVEVAFVVPGDVREECGMDVALMPFALAGAIPAEAAGSQFACGAVDVCPSSPGPKRGAGNVALGLTFGTKNVWGGLLPVWWCLSRAVASTNTNVVKVGVVEVAPWWRGSVAHFLVSQF